MLVLVGPSASGKTQAGIDLNKKYGLSKLVTYTTRSMRPGEVNHVDYHFLSLDEFMNNINNKFFLEYVSYNNNYYGTSESDFSSDKYVILEPNGLYTYINKVRDKIKVVYLKCSKDVLRNRMINRGDTKEQINNRLSLDDKVFTSELENVADLVIDTSDKDEYTVCEMIYNYYKEYMND